MISIAPHPRLAEGKGVVPGDAVRYGPLRHLEQTHFWAAFIKTCELFPDRVALQSDQCSLTYVELRRAAESLAREVRDRGARGNAPVVIFLNHGTNILVGLLAVLAGGNHFVPVNVNDPAGRIETIIKNVGAQVVVTETSAVQKLGSIAQGLELVLIDAPRQQHGPDVVQAQSGRARAYIVHTSGSTGAPKGVVIAHRSWANFSAHMVEALKVTAEDKVLMATPYTFDVSLMEVGMAMFSGAALVVPTIRQQRNSGLMNDFIKRHDVTIGYLSQRLALKMDPTALTTLRCICFGGEAILEKTVTMWHADRREVINIYGPSETTIAPLIKKCAPDAKRNPPIGRPITNHYVWLEDDAGQPITNSGSIGEIIVGGIGVGLGYLNTPPNSDGPFGRAQGITLGYDPRIYRTGDLGYWDAAGELHFVGRFDQQVSLGGVRIELLEVEMMLSKHPLIEAVVVALFSATTEYEQDHLCAFVKPVPGTSEIPSLLVFLSSRLPSGMIPSRIEYVKAFKYSSSGKLIRPKQL